MAQESLTTVSGALANLCKHKDVVSLYFVRSHRRFVVTAIAATNGGALVLSEFGQLVGSHPSKAAALASISQEPSADLSN